MLNILRTVISAAVLTAGLLWISLTPSYAKPEYATKEGKGCTFCHVAEGETGLNDAGKFYAAHDHSLEGYTPAKE
jgi:hypothetical protein